MNGPRDFRGSIRNTQQSETELVEQKSELIGYRTRANAASQLLRTVETVQSEAEETPENQALLAAILGVYANLQKAEIQEESSDADAAFQAATQSLLEIGVISQEDLDELLRESRLEVGE